MLLKVGSGQRSMRLIFLKMQIITVISTRISYLKNLALNVALPLSEEGNLSGNANSYLVTNRQKLNQ